MQAGAELGLLQAVSKAYTLELQSYLPMLDGQRAEPLSSSAALPAGRGNAVRVIEVSTIMYDKRESALDSLFNILAAMGEHYGVGLMLRGGREKCSLYLVTRVYAEQFSAVTGHGLLTQGMTGHFAGSRLRTLSNEEAQGLLNRCFPEKARNWGVCSSSVVPNLKHDDNMTTFTQSLDRFIDAMAGREYTALILAEPLGQDSLDVMQRSMENTGTLLSPLQKRSFTVSQSEGTSSVDTISRTITQGINESVTHSQSHARTESFSRSRGTSTSKGTSESTSTSLSGTLSRAFTMAGALGVGLFVPVKALMMGINLSGSLAYTLGKAVSLGLSRSKGTSHTETQNQGETEGTGATDTTGRSRTSGKSREESLGGSSSIGSTQEQGSSTMVEFSDMGICRFHDRLEEKLDRLDDVRACGAWSAAAFFVAADHKDAAVAASLYQGMMRGQESMKNASALLHWQADGAQSVMAWLRELLLPRFSFDNLTVTPGVPVSSRELALMMCLPRRSVGGVTVVESVGFGREVRSLRELPQDASRRFLSLGSVYHKNRQERAPVTLDVESLCRHVLVSGTTGTGKSRAMQHMLCRLHEIGVPFLVIEPAKNEYRGLRGLPGVKVLRAGSFGSDGLHLNPFVFPAGSGVTLSSHVDRVCAVFNAAFPMYAAMPQVLEKAVYQAYENCGWDIASSRSVSGALFPTVADVAEQVKVVVEGAGYRGESYDTYIGALKARLDSFAYGSLGLVLSSSPDEETSADVLFNGSCVVNVADMGSPEKKAVLMGVLLMRLQEQRMADRLDEKARGNLLHATVIEEAHNLLRATGPVVSQEGSGSRQQAVEFFANAIGEMRAYGEGFFVVDQSASALDASVLRNTGTKIAFNAPLEEDRKILAGAMALDDLQQEALARLPVQIAAVKQNDWTETVLCRVQDWSAPESSDEAVEPEESAEEKRRIRARLVMLVAEAAEGAGASLDREEKTALHRWTQRQGFDRGVLIALKNIIDGRPFSGDCRMLFKALLGIDDRFFSCAVSAQGRDNRLMIRLSDVLNSASDVKRIRRILEVGATRGSNA